MRKIKKLLPFILSFMLLSACSAPSSSSGGSYRQISMDEAVKMMKYEKDYIILDVRRPDEFAEGHIPGAINIPNEEIGTDEIEELPDKSQLILVYCRSGRRSKEASEKLVRLGYTSIVEFGGILDWQGDIEK
jgi:rhodanese-related sulfurtransferase